MVNQVILLGRIGNISSKCTPSGTAVCEMSIATSEFYTDKQGEKQEKTSWHNVVTYGKRAETCGKFLEKGRQVFISGRLNYVTWDKPDGSKGYKTEIIAENVQFIGGQGNGSGQAQQQTASAEAPAYFDDENSVPFQL